MSDFFSAEPARAAQPASRSAPPALWALTIVSLLLNVLIIAILILVDMVGRQIAASVADQLEAFGNQTINYKFRVNQTVPVNTLVPFQKNLVVPFQQSIPVSTTVKVSKELPVLGVVEFDVPIDTSVPVSFSVPIAISETIAVNAEVPLNLEIPLEIPVRDTPIKETLDRVAQALNTFAGR